MEEVGNRGLILAGGVLPNDVSELLPSGCAFSEAWRALGWPDPSGQWEALDPGGGEEGTGMGWLSSLKGPSLRTTGSKKQRGSAEHFPTGIQGNSSYRVLDTELWRRLCAIKSGSGLLWVTLKGSARRPPATGRPVRSKEP